MITASPPNPTPRPQPLSRDEFRVFVPITSRWSDNDVYGHVNNVVYYSWFDTGVNTHLIAQGVLDTQGGAAIGLVVETHCNYFAPLSFPQKVEVGIRVSSIGRSSARYELGIFGIPLSSPLPLSMSLSLPQHHSPSPTAAAQGHFVHVYVDAITRKPVPLPLPLKTVLTQLL